jgi:hypothetical protein
MKRPVPSAPPSATAAHASLRSLIDETLCQPANAVSYRMGAALSASFPAKHVLETSDGDFDLRRFERDGRCTVEWLSDTHSQRTTSWRRAAPHIHEETRCAWMRASWEAQEIDIVRLDWKEGFEREHRLWVVAASKAEATRFFHAVCSHCHVPRGEVLVFHNGCWSGSTSMYEAVQATSFDDLILAGALKDEIRGDLEQFLRSRSEYERYHVPWKRGILFVGPPGNGKTHCLRACIRLLDVTCIYVQSLKSRYETEDGNVRSVFDRARELTPCCLVFEDLDAMITPKNRSFFLNQLDGFEHNDGILTLATTNHPERLDPAIVNRPSRFDRKYHFALPERDERSAYIAMWNARLDPEMRLRLGTVIERLVDETEAFSFAYVKELFVSSMVRWMCGTRKGEIAPVLFEQLALLREQMHSEAGVVPPPAADGAISREDDDD